MKKRAKTRQKVVRCHAKIADCRRDAIHKATRTLIDENQVTCIESLTAMQVGASLSVNFATKRTGEVGNWCK